MRCRMTMRRNALGVMASVSLGVLGAGCAELPERDPFEGEGAEAVGSEGQALIVPGTEVFDFLIQDVCVVGGSVTALDPRTCPGTTRNLLVDEALPYRRVTDHVPNTPGGQVEISDSFPIRGPDYTPRVVHTFNASTMSWPGNERSFLDFDSPPLAQLGQQPPPIGSNPFAPHSDGYEVSEVQGTWAALVGTRDAHGVAPFYAPGCGHDDSWIQFPTSVPAVGTGGYVEARIGSKRVPFEPRTQLNFGCPAVPQAGAGTFYLRGHWTFNHGEVLETVISSHYDHPTPEASVAMERFFYTRPYGRTRWESWQKPTSGNPSPAADTSCTGPTSDLGFVRVACREFTKVVPDPVGGFEPRSWPVHQFMARGNLIQNHSFAMNDLSGWGEFATATRHVSIERYAATDLRDGNRFAVARRGGPGASLYQDVPRPGTVVDDQWMSFGVRAWAGSSQTVRVVVFQLGSSAPYAFVDATVNATRKLVSGAFHVAPGAQTFRFQVYLESSGDIQLDDAWLTPM